MAVDRIANFWFRNDVDHIVALEDRLRLSVGLISRTEFKLTSGIYYNYSVN